MGQGMDIKTLQQGKHARIKETGQVVHIKQISDHGIALVKFRTGGEFLLLNDRLESVDTVEVQH
jgi:hypothetical protein